MNKCLKESLKKINTSAVTKVYILFDSYSAKQFKIQVNLMWIQFKTQYFP